MGYMMQKYSEKCWEVNDIEVLGCRTPEGPYKGSSIMEYFLRLALWM